MTMILEGIRIIDWTVAQQGPVATTLLADLGADVIKIESPDGELGRTFTVKQIKFRGGRNFYFEANNRNKRAITLDFRKEEAKEIVYRLVEKSDVFVQNWRKGVAAKLGLDYQTLCRHNPKLIYASGSAFGPEGPDSEKPGLDVLGLARSGLMLAIGHPDWPPVLVGDGFSDQVGAMMLSWGILAALVARERFGIGQEVQSSLLGSMITAQGLNVMAYLLLGTEFGRRDRKNANNPLSNTYRCSDGKWLALAGVGSRASSWHNLCVALGKVELENDPRFSNAENRAKNTSALVAILDTVFACETRDEWLLRLGKSPDLLFTYVNAVPDLPNDPQVLASKYIVDFEHPVWGKVKEVGFPVSFSKTPASLRREAPMLGQHTEEVLTEILGYSWDEISRLRDKGVF